MEEAFAHAIAATPDDNLVRLVYADWLEEQGDPRAGFIRLQVKLREIASDKTDRFLLRLAIAIEKLHRLAEDWERQRPDRRANAWLAFVSSQDAPVAYADVTWASGIVLQHVVTPAMLAEEAAPARTATMQGILACGGVLRTEAMTRSTDGKTEEWFFYELPFGNDIELATVTTRVILLNAHGPDEILDVQIKMTGPTRDGLVKRAEPVTAPDPAT